MANRNGFFYVLDRRPASTCSVRLTRSRRGLEGSTHEAGRSCPRHGAFGERNPRLSEPAGIDQLVQPVVQPDTGLLYVPVREMGSIYYKSPVEYRRGTYFTGGSEKRLDEESWGAVRAIDVKTGHAAWDFKLPTPPWAGVMATAGGLVFGGSNEGNFYAVDAKTGKPLWQFQTGGPIRCGPMSFLVRRQAARGRVRRSLTLRVRDRLGTT